MSAVRLVRRGVEGRETEYVHELDMGDRLPEKAPRPAGRVVRFEIPDGFMATISLVPYTEPPAAFPEPESD